MIYIQAPMTEASAHSTIPAVSEVTSPSETKIRSTKRKLHDAFEVLDSAVTTAHSDTQPPLKRANTFRSLYSTLAKYGIKSRRDDSQSTSLSTSKNTPHLTAILNRAAAKAKAPFSFTFTFQPKTSSPSVSTTADYRPSSLPSFLSRLATYKLTTYANKPPSIDAVAASKCGWINDGKDRLVCGLCNASWVVAGREGMNRDAANALIEKQRVSLVEAHKNGCPWKTRQCEDFIYCVPLQSPAGAIKEIEAKAATMDPVIKDISTKHPLTASQLNSLRDVLSLYARQTANIMDVDTPEGSSDTSAPSLLTSQPSETAILAALFGWSLVPPVATDSLRRSSTGRASKPLSLLSSPALSRASSVSRELPNTPSKAPRKSIGTDMSLRLPSAVSPVKTENALLQCELCQRRLGVWAFMARSAVVISSADSRDPPSEDASSNETTGTPNSTRPKKALPRRSFDLLKEHRSYCPYVVRSTVVPSLPLPPKSTASVASSSSSSTGHSSSMSISQFNDKTSTSGTIEGWKALLLVVLRYGMAQRQRIEYNLLTSKDALPDTAGQEQDNMEVDSVKAMVSDVKARGGKDLLKYVRGLLG